MIILCIISIIIAFFGIIRLYDNILAIVPLIVMVYIYCNTIVYVGFSKSFKAFAAFQNGEISNLLSLEDYLEIFEDMQRSANHYNEIGVKFKNEQLIENAIKIISLCEEAKLANSNSEAESFYNEIRGEILGCEEIVEGFDFEGDE